MLSKMSKYRILKDTRATYELKLILAENAEKNIWDKGKKSNEQTRKY